MIDFNGPGGPPRRPRGAKTGGLLMRYVFPLGGLALLAALLWHADLGAVGRGLVAVGWLGAGAVLGIHAVSFLADVVLWQMAYEGIPPSLRWCLRLYGVRLVGEAFNNITPLASMGGEPVKAQVMKSRYGIGYGASAVAFMIAKTANLLALVVFLAVGFAAMLADPRFAGGYTMIAGAGLGAFTAGIAALYVAQRSRLASRATRRLAGSRAGLRVAAVLESVERFDESLLRCYRHAPRRFATITGLALLTWLAGIFEIWVILWAAGHPVSLLDCWIVEAVAQLVRTAAFFIPGGLGAVEAGFVVVVGSVTGSASLGVVVAIVRRFRDLVWIVLGVAWSLPLGVAVRAPSPAGPTESGDRSA